MPQSKGFSTDIIIFRSAKQHQYKIKTNMFDIYFINQHCFLAYLHYKN